MKKKNIFIDSCAWNFLFDNNIDFSTHFPIEYFELFMTKEITSFEVPLIQDSQIPLKKYIERNIREFNIIEDAYFGFASYSDPPDYKYRVSGFGKGRFIGTDEAIIMQKLKKLFPSDKFMKTALYKNEADISVAIRAMTGSIILTKEKRTKNGPIQWASRNDGRVIFLPEIDLRITTIGNYINTEYP